MNKKFDFNFYLLYFYINFVARTEKRGGSASDVTNTITNKSHAFNERVLIHLKLFLFPSRGSRKRSDAMTIPNENGKILLYVRLFSA